MGTVRNAAYYKCPAEQKRLSIAGRSEFSHPDGLPLRVKVQRIGWCRKRVIVWTLEKIWYRDVVVELEIDKGTLSDLATIPWFLWWLLDPFELAMEALFHDELYRSGIVSREFADFLFRYMQAQLGKPLWVRWTSYLAVRLFGRKAWDEHRANDAERKGNE